MKFNLEKAGIPLQIVSESELIVCQEKSKLVKYKIEIKEKLGTTAGIDGEVLTVNE